MKLEIYCNFPEYITYSPTDEEKNEFKKEELIEKLEKLGLANIKITKKKTQRTLNQNSAYWKYLEMVCEEATNSGQTMEILFKDPHSFFLTPEILHEFNKKVLEFRTKKTSTTELNTLEFSQFIDEIMRIYAARLDVNFPFPSYLNLE